MLGAQSDLGEGFLIAEDGRCVWANAAYQRISGYTLEELTAMSSLLDIATPEERAVVQERMRQRGENRQVPEHYETAMIRKDGARITLEVSHKPLYVGGKRRNITIVRNITERKRVEEALRISQQRFAEAYQHERDVTERLRALDEMKNGFLTAVSHELRTPLTSVLGFAQTLEDHDARLTQEMRANLLERLTANANKLNRLLSDLLDVDRARRGILEPKRQPVEVYDVVARVVEEWQHVSHRYAQIDGGSLLISADPAKLERIVENLLSNAAKYSPEEGRIWVRFWRESGGAIVAVEDEGAGVPDPVKGSVFEPFMRVGGGSAHAPGTGIGLSLVAQFAAIHGGRAWVEDRTGGGAAFKVFLPDVPARAAS